MTYSCVDCLISMRKLSILTILFLGFRISLAQFDEVKHINVTALVGDEIVIGSVGPLYDDINGCGTEGLGFSMDPPSVHWMVGCKN